MLLLSHRPAPPLDAFVDSLWLLHAEPAHPLERIVPSGTLELVIDLRRDELRIHDPLRPNDPARFSGAVVSGAYSRCFVADTLQHESILGVHFKPGGAFPFLAAAPRPAWPELALACGYFDQSHLIRDFRAFSGLSPVEYARRQSDDVKENHLPIEA